MTGKVVSLPVEVYLDNVGDGRKFEPPKICGNFNKPIQLSERVYSGDIVVVDLPVGKGELPLVKSVDGPVLPIKKVTDRAPRGTLYITKVQRSRSAGWEADGGILQWEAYSENEQGTVRLSRLLIIATDSKPANLYTYGFANGDDREIFIGNDVKEEILFGKYRRLVFKTLLENAAEIRRAKPRTTFEYRLYDINPNLVVDVWRDRGYVRACLYDDPEDIQRPAFFENSVCEISIRKLGKAAQEYEAGCRLEELA